MSLRETDAQKQERLQLEARAIREQRLAEERSTRSTGMAQPKPKAKPRSMFEAVVDAVKGKNPITDALRKK